MKLGFFIGAASAFNNECTTPDGKYYTRPPHRLLHRLLRGIIYSFISAGIRCNQSCQDDMFECVLSCAPGDSMCLSECNRVEFACFDDCPCYTNCLEGCPCTTEQGQKVRFITPSKYTGGTLESPTL